MPGGNAEPVALSRELSRDPSRNYALLRSEGVALVQQLSGRIWTDYNEHDPGVTILEQLCYALTELAYRADLPIENLIAGRDPPLLLGPARAFPTEPVTELDWRRLLIDRVHGLANLWLDPRISTGDEPTGLYDLSIYAAPPVPGLYDPGPAGRHIEHRTVRAFVRHRLLCEDLGSVRVLRPARLRIAGTIDIDPESAPEAAMAAIVQRLACTLAPEPRRHSLRQMLDRRLPLDRIFDGPRVSRGFILPCDLGDRRTSVDSRELSDRLATLPAVRAVGPLTLWLGGRRYQPGKSCVLGPGEYFSFHSGLDQDEVQIELRVRRQPQPVRAHEAVRLLKALWSEHRRTYKVAAEIHHLLSPPAAQPRGPAAWQPVADQFPAVYGIGRDGPGRDATPLRRAQARQLAGYLAVFEQPMKDFLVRLAAFPALLRGELPAGPLTAAEEEGLLDFLLALCGEAPGPLIVVPPDRGEAAAALLRVQAKRHLLLGQSGLRKSRGRGLDYGVRHWRRRSSGVELRSRIMLPVEPWVPRRWRPRLSIVEHVLLRPAGEGGCRPGPSLRPMAITAVVHLPGRERRSAEYRHRVSAMIRANTPAHIAVETRFVDRDRWVRFRRLHKLWRRALRYGVREAADLIAQEMLGRFELWGREEQ